MYSCRMNRLAHIILYAVLVGLILLSPAYSDSHEEDSSEAVPDRMITMAAAYPAVQVPPDVEEVTMDLIFYNKGKSDESVRFWISEQPKGWTSRIKTYRYAVAGIHVPSESDKTVTFETRPEQMVPPGKYQFLISAKTTDGRFQLNQAISIEVLEERSTELDRQDLKLTTSYPVIRGPSDATFEFSVEVDSDLDEDAVFDLSARGPKGWEINFKPAYDNKYISSLRLKANESKSVDVEVKPSVAAQTGEHPIEIRVGSGNVKAEGSLTVILTGTYQLDVGTPNGLLSLDAKRGKPANVSFYIKNTGSAANSGIKFLSFKPENWKVAFNPESINSIPPGELKQVEMTITPYEDALVGDYSVSVTVNGERVSKNLEFRTTVKASAAWGWVGIGIIVIVIVGLMGLFRWLGRR